jgi:hypothetical protein
MRPKALINKANTQNGAGLGLVWIITFKVKLQLILPLHPTFTWVTLPLT